MGLLYVTGACVLGPTHMPPPQQQKPQVAASSSLKECPARTSTNILKTQLFSQLQQPISVPPKDLHILLDTEHTQSEVAPGNQLRTALHQ